MANLTDSTNLTGTITISKATGTKVTLDTDHKYLSKDIELTINAQTTSATVSGNVVSYGSGWISAGSTTVTDANLIASNIKKNVTIFGITGTLDTGNIIIVDTPDDNGGTIRTITSIDTPTVLQTKSNITPGASSVTVTPDTGYDGMTSVQINGDANLIASNIKSGVTIFGVTGSYAGSGTGSGGYVTQDENGYIVIPSTGGNGGGSSSVSATQHTIHLEFSDSTTANINLYYDDSLISSMITAYTPSTYNSKTVTLAQLDNTTWYQPAAIAIGVQLIDYTKTTQDYAINSNGEVYAEQWYSVSDYTPIDPSMTFSYRGCYWFNMAFYTSSKTLISALSIYSDGTQDTNDTNVGYGTLSGNKIPSNAAYIRITGGYTPNSDNMSLIRTA